MGWAKDGSGLSVKRVRGMTLPQFTVRTDLSHTLKQAARIRRTRKGWKAIRKGARRGLGS